MIWITSIFGHLRSLFLIRYTKKTLKIKSTHYKILRNLIWKKKNTIEWYFSSLWKYVGHLIQRKVERTNIKFDGTYLDRRTISYPLVCCHLVVINHNDSLWHLASAKKNPKYSCLCSRCAGLLPINASVLRGPFISMMCDVSDMADWPVLPARGRSTLCRDLCRFSQMFQFASGL